MTKPTSAALRDYFRRDQSGGVSPPDLSKECTFAEHIVHARGKRTQFTSVSLDLSRIRDFGDANYRVERQRVVADSHLLVEHEALLDELKRAAQEERKGERLRAAQALRYARRRREGLIEWSFDIAGVDRKELIAWARGKIQAYFVRMR